MSCSTFDVKGYLLGEMAEADRRRTEDHIAMCPQCREESQRLDVTRQALLALPDEEAPRRIAFVSDKIFEPRWWQRGWTLIPQMAAMAVMLAAGYAIAPKPAAPARLVAGITEQQVEARVQAAVTKAVAESEARQGKNTAALLEATEKKYDLDRRGLLLAIDDNNRLVGAQLTQLYKNVMVASNQPAGGQ